MAHAQLPIEAFRPSHINRRIVGLCIAIAQVLTLQLTLHCPSNVFFFSESLANVVVFSEGLAMLFPLVRGLIG